MLTLCMELAQRLTSQGWTVCAKTLHEYVCSMSDFCNEVQSRNSIQTTFAGSGVGTCHVQVHISADVHGIEADPFTREPIKADVKLQPVQVVIRRLPLTGSGTN